MKTQAIQGHMYAAPFCDRGEDSRRKERNANLKVKSEKEKILTGESFV